MPIDKIIPRFLVSDKDERLLKEGAMTDALNVTISEDGDGTEGVLKNVKGTTAASPASDSELFAATKVIGQVSDPQRGFIYYFTVNSSGLSDAIYQYNTKSSTNGTLAANSYRVIIQNNELGFDHNGFVKADILNINIDGSLNTLLYFTDGLKSPRKINVDRAVAGAYDQFTGSNFVEHISAIKAANNKFPLVSFDSDTNVLQNNFNEDTFQFATQNIFQDGEESAISPYSEIAVSKVLFLNTMETSGFATNPFIDNVCLVNIQLDPVLPDLKEVRLLARRGNSGAFFVVDQFDPTTVLSRHIAGNSVTVYSPTTNTYRFYNNTLGEAVPTQTVNKLYDNVPLSAKGQAIAGNRVVYSNYKEGFDNVTTSVTLSVEYSPLTDKDEQFISSNQTQYVISQATAISPSINVNLLGGTAFDSLDVSGTATKDTTVPAGTKIRLSFDWGGAEKDITVSAGTTGGGVFRVEGTFVATSTLGPNFSFSDPGVVLKSSDSVVLQHYSDSDQDGISIDYVVPQDQSIEDIGSALEDIMTGKTIDYLYTIDDVQFDVVTQDITNAPDSLQSSYDNWTGLDLDGNVNATFDFSNTSTLTGTGQQGFQINPKLIKVEKSSAVFSVDDISDSGFNNYNLFFNMSHQQEANILGDQSDTGTLAYAVTDPDFVSNRFASANVIQAKPTFKSGSTHSFGIVYYDEFNRSGFVNELGSCYVKTVNERKNSDPAINNLGPASVKITFSHDPPSWAERYQIVYAGPDSIDDYVQYTTGPAYVATSELSSATDANKHLTDVQNKRLYVSLTTLESYREEKNVSRNYSFTKGDRLRLISRRADDNDSTLYPKANDDSQIEFEVVDVVILSKGTDPVDTTEPIQIARESHGTDAPDDKYTGTFLVLEASRINGGETNSSGDAVRYVGFDWGDVSGFDLTTGTDSTIGTTTINHWGKETLVEIYTPKKTTSQKVYYEMGHGDRCGSRKADGINEHGVSITVTNGDSWLRPVACKTALHADTSPGGGVQVLDGDTLAALGLSNTSAWAARDFYDSYGYQTLFIESNTLSDRFDSRIWSQGRAHAPFKKAKEITRINGLTYSDAYAEDVSNLSLSSFNPSLANFSSLDLKFGAIDYIGNYNEDVVAIQENKLALIPVNKNIIEYASGNADVSVSTDVLQQHRYSSGDYGSSGHPEAVIIQDNTVYFVDKSRQAVLSLTGGQLVPISEKNMSSFFEDFFATNNDRYVSGYDPRDNTYYITALGGSTPETVGYDVARGVWQSRYSFTPDIYSNQDNMLYSAKYVDADTDLIFHKHDSTAYNTFYGTEYPSTVQVVSKLSPSRVKVFNAISYEGDSAEWDTPSDTPIQTSLQMFAGQITSWSEREGSYYASIPKDAINPELLYLGTISSAANDGTSSTLTMSDMVRFDRLPIDLITTTDPAHSIPLSVGTQLITSFSQSDKQITLFGNFSDPSSLGGTKLYAKILNSHALRGHWAKITLTNSSTTKHELYCINTHITDSKLHHPLGQ
tara:strand:- start:338 stop:4837 length:4500 start_codon:yes stop_codon:yes gene_type:complete